MNRSLFTQYSVYIFWRRLSLWCCSVMLTLLWGGKALLGGVRSVDKTNTLLSLAGPMFGLVFMMSIMISKTWLLCKANEQRKLLPPLYFTSSWFQHLKQNESLLLITDYDIAQSLCFDQYSLETSFAAFLYTHISLTDNNNESWKKKTTFLSWLQNSLYKQKGYLS